MFHYVKKKKMREWQQEKEMSPARFLCLFHFCSAVHFTENLDKMYFFSEKTEREREKEEGMRGSDGFIFSCFVIFTWFLFVLLSLHYNEQCQSMFVCFFLPIEFGSTVENEITHSKYNKKERDKKIRRDTFTFPISFFFLLFFMQRSNSKSHDLLLGAVGKPPGTKKRKHAKSSNERVFHKKRHTITFSSTIRFIRLFFNFAYLVSS